MGNVGITLSRADPAGVNLLGSLRGMGFEETEQPNVLRMGDMYLIVVDPLIVPEERYRATGGPDPYPTDYDGVAKAYRLDYFVVASRHWASSGKPSLTVHPTGNFGKAMYGGRPRELQRTLANPMRDIFLELKVDPPRGFEVSLEATHHSPTQFEIPMFFAELGSGKNQWEDQGAGAYLAEAIVRGIGSRGRAPVAVGFGGGHYCPTFSAMEAETAFGHMAAKYALDIITEDLVVQMVERTVDGVEGACFNSGLKGYQRKKVEVALRKLDIPVME